MGDDGLEIKIIGVSKEEIRADSDKADFWIVPFQLSGNPDDLWQKKFYDVHQKNTDVMKRKARVNGNFLQAEVSAADDLQKVLDALKIEVAETNVLCAEDHQKKIEIRKKLEALQQKQRDTTQQFKEDTDTLMF